MWCCLITIVFRIECSLKLYSTVGYLCKMSKRHAKKTNQLVMIKDKESGSTCLKHHFSVDEIVSFQKNILQWYDTSQRKLPWRDIAKYETDCDIRGYAVWVSEVMLQQTQVATVVDYYKKWMKKWPSVKDLANASLEEVNETWAGLGYYSRARRLHDGAKIVASELQGHIPQTAPELLDLIPGIGQYTAAAIASVAYQKPVGVVDGNVSRVLSRVRAIGCEISKPSARNLLWELANAVVSRERPGDFNQALMELGAMVCTPRNPKCEACPLSDLCTAYSMVKESDTQLKIHLKDEVKKSTREVKISNKSKQPVIDIENVPDCPFCLPRNEWKSNPQVTIYPRKAKKKSPRIETVAVVVVEKEGSFLMQQRPKDGLLAGLWEFPSVVLPDPQSILKNEECQLDKLKELGIKPSIAKRKKHVGAVNHLFSHINTTYVVEHLHIDKSVVVSDEKTRWLSKEEIKDAAVSSAMKKILKSVENHKSLQNEAVSKKRKRSPVKDSKQKCIKSFFCSKS